MPTYGDPDGHGLYGQLTYTDDGTQVICHECGQEKRALGTHAWYAHQITAAEYRERHGLSTRQGLAAPETAARFSVNGLRKEALAALAAHRDPDRARAANTAEGRTRPQRQQVRRETGARSRLGRDITPTEMAMLVQAEAVSIAAWAQIAHQLLGSGATQGSISRATGLPASTVAQRMHRYPPAETAQPASQAPSLMPPGTTLPLSDDPWWIVYAIAQAFYRREGHLLIPQDHVEAGRRVGKWVSKQRYLHALAELPGSRVRLLEQIGMVWNPLDAVWETWFRLAERFYRREGHLLVPHAHVEDDEALGNWIMSQRSVYPNIPPERVRRLETIGMVWRLRNRPRPIDAGWEAWFQLAEAFYRREGHLRVPWRHVEEGRDLGRWIEREKRAYWSGRSPDDVIARLEAIGMKWGTGAQPDSSA
ncbi:Helicase associated domain protein [Streptosporangium saharense]|uniref:Helicase associated domain protein n=1 Tax=Streptosporangium saharense TaxID=1706840 RepID=UPI003331A197